MGRRTAAQAEAVRRERAARKKDEYVFETSLEYEFSCGLRLRVEEAWHDDGDGIAGLQWAGGVRLARFFDDFRAGSWVGKKCVELGAGCGLTSCVLAALGASVVCTDAEPKHAEATLVANEAAMRARCESFFVVPLCERFDWGPIPPASCSSADVVIAGDCLYEEKHAHLLVEALEGIADAHTVIYVCGAVGTEAHAAFQRLAPVLFEVRRGDELVETWDSRALLTLRRRAPPLSSVAPLSKTPVSPSRFNSLGDAVEPFASAVDPLVVDDALSDGECAALVAALVASPELSFWGKDDAARRFRDADTLEVRHPALADALWRRLEPLLNMEAVRHVDDALVHDAEALWRPVSLNDHLLFAAYPVASGHFAPHTDGATRQGLNVRSFYSVIIYLNDTEGGETRFYEDEAASKLVFAQGRWTARDRFVTADVRPKRGRVLVFHQSRVHEGRPSDTPKYIIRSDVLFARQPPVFDQPHERRAYTDYETALEAAADGRHDEAQRLFDSTRRLSPDLAAALGL